MNPIKSAIKIAIIVAAMVGVGWSVILFDSYREPLKAQLLPYGPPLGVNASPNATGDFELLCQLMQKGCPGTPHKLLRPESTGGSALTELQYAAEQGQLDAQWKLARMYADADGVPRDDLRAFSYFNQIANSHPDETPGTWQAQLVANAVRRPRALLSERHTKFENRGRSRSRA
jgi:hypothetical protein